MPFNFSKAMDEALSTPNVSEQEKRTATTLLQGVVEAVGKGLRGTIELKSQNDDFGVLVAAYKENRLATIFDSIDPLWVNHLVRGSISVVENQGRNGGNHWSDYVFKATLVSRGAPNSSEYISTKWWDKDDK